MTSTPVAIIVNAPPSVSLASPSSSDTFKAPAEITLTADASDPDGTIGHVEFFSGATLIGSATAPPYSIVWSAVPQGSYSLSARVTDNHGAVTSSAPVGITVSQAAAQIHFIHTDHLNTPRLITNEVGQVVWSWANDDPFGANVPNENPSGLGIFTCNLRLPGQYFDNETGLHYNYFRNYDAATGRYIESDPIGLRGGVNTYLYVLANPLSNVDPIGWRTVKVCGAENGPKFPDNFGPYSFAQACINHDACYDDCLKRPTKAECDSRFVMDTQNTCKSIPWFWAVLGAQRECVSYSLQYSIAIEAAGQKAFNEARAKCRSCTK